jgi:acyl-CoA thioesterase FadM
MLVRQRIERDGEVLASALVQVVCIRLDGRPVKLPADVVRALVGPTP